VSQHLQHVLSLKCGDKAAAALAVAAVDPGLWEAKVAHTAGLHALHLVQIIFCVVVYVIAAVLPALSAAALQANFQECAIVELVLYGVCVAALAEFGVAFLADHLAVVVDLDYGIPG
jgi:hypothetical protein